jgi:ABC-type multidrug transport system fused ATPase/permease subunit
MEVLLSSSALAGDILERTSSTVRVQQMVQLSLAPVFMTWIVDRVHLLEKLEENKVFDREIEELPALRRRRKYAHRAINMSTTAALVICAVVALLFVSAFVRPALGTYVALGWILAMGLVFTALLTFLLETQLATKSTRATRRLSHELESRGDASADE